MQSLFEQATLKKVIILDAGVTTVEKHFIVSKHCFSFADIIVWTFVRSQNTVSYLEIETQNEIEPRTHWALLPMI